MVMRVWLVRHGQAAPGTPDGERRLTPEGEAEVETLAQWCLANDVAPRKIRHSGILRAVQTAEVLAGRLSPAAGVRAARGLGPDDDPTHWAEELKHEDQPVLIVTHMPFVGDLAALLTGRMAPLVFVPAEIVCLERDGERWRASGGWRPQT